MKDWNFLLNIWTRDWVRAIRSSSVFFLLVRKQTKHGINLYSYNIVLATHKLNFFFYLPHNSVVILMLRNKTWNDVCVVLRWFHSVKVFEVAALLLAGWTVHHVRDQSLARFFVLFWKSSSDYRSTTASFPFSICNTL